MNSNSKHILEKKSVSLEVNERRHEIMLEPRRTLLDALRQDCALTGTKKTCDMGNCGACTVLLDGKAVYSCLVLAVECEGQAISTIEGLAEGEQLDPLQQSFIDYDAFQCGYCTPGQILSLKALFDAVPLPSNDEIKQAVAGNLCRCGAYRHILEAAASVAQANRERSDKAGAE